MKLTQGIHLYGSGAFGLTSADDCHHYVPGGGSELTLIDCGLTGNSQAILLQMKKDGLDTGKLRCLFLTRAHSGHTNGGAWLQEYLGVQMIVGALEAWVMEQGLLETLGIHPEPGLYEQFDNMGCSRVDRIIEDDEKMQVGELRARALLTPGHAAGSTGYEVEVGDKRHVFVGDGVLYQEFVDVLMTPFSDHEHYYEGLERLRGRGVDGLFPSHLMWTLQDEQKHIDKTLWNFEVPQRPNLKPFS